MKWYTGVIISIIGFIITSLSYNAMDHPTIMSGALEFTQSSLSPHLESFIPVYIGIALISLGLTIILYQIVFGDVK